MIDNIRSGLPLLSAEQIEEKLIQSFSSEAHVLVVYLFGSNAREEAGCLSDVGIAVLFDDSFTKKEAFEL